jgi:hypothetical protein
MAKASKVGVVYAVKSGILRRWIIPDDDAGLQHHPVSPGEAMLVVDRASLPPDPLQVQPFVEAAIARATGKGVPSPRCAVVDAAGDVVAVIMADPDIDQVPGHSLVLHPAVERGWKMRAGVLVDVVAEARAVSAAAAELAGEVAVDLVPEGGASA